MKLPYDKIDKMLAESRFTYDDFSFEATRSVFYQNLTKCRGKEINVTVRYRYNGIYDSCEQEDSVNKNLLRALKGAIDLATKDNKRLELLRSNPPSKYVGTLACTCGDWGGPCGNLHCNGGEGEDYDWNGGW